MTCIRRNPFLHSPILFPLTVALALLLLVGCDSSAPDTDGDGVADILDAFPMDPTETSDFDGDGIGDRLDADPEDATRTSYASPGPYTVGITTLEMGDRQLEVFYPVEEGAAEGVEPASYDLIDPFPESVQTLILLQAPDINAPIDLPAYRDLPSSRYGPFPVILFSHGSGGFRRAYSKYLSGVASHGFVVASLDHLEWGLLSRLGLGPPEESAREPGELILSALTLLDTEYQDPDSVLSGTADTSQVATIGHSAGGRAAFSTESQQNPNIKTMIGYATVPFEEIPEKPVLLLLGAEDLAVTTETTLAVYDLLAFEKRYASVDGAGHNSFTDQCEVLFEGNDIIAAAQFIFGDAFPDSLVALARDGCEPDNLAPRDFWEVAQHFTVAHVRKAFSLNSEPRGLTAGAAGLFEDITVDYRFEEP